MADIFGEIREVRKALWAFIIIIIIIIINCAFWVPTGRQTQTRMTWICQSVKTLDLRVSQVLLANQIASFSLTFPVVFF